MKRIELFEFEDYHWFPSWLRACLTNLILVLHKMVGVSEALADLMANILTENGISKIVDLGSGSGGPMPQVVQILRKDHNLPHIKLIMTDLYPNPVIVEKFNTQGEEGICYQESPVDATNSATVPEGLKTMVNSFHHMSPEKARKILESAEHNNQPILIYEMAENTVPLVVWWVLLPISLAILFVMALFMTPFVKPLTWRQLVFTYLIPIIPICYAWDGQASLPRMYTLKDMDVLLKGLGTTKKYVWTKGQVRKRNHKKLGTFVLGMPGNDTEP